MRSRLLDLAVITVCVACIAAPFLATSNAADANAPVLEGTSSIDQRVLAGGVISNPLDGTFQGGGSGTRDGSVSWDLWSTGSDGLKLVVSTTRSPAMRDTKNGVDVADYGITPSTWAVADADRRFGFSVSGDHALAKYDSGSKWRGFEAGRAVEVARRGSPSPRTRATVKLRAQFAAALPAGATPTATIRATALPNL